MVHLPQNGFDPQPYVENLTSGIGEEMLAMVLPMLLVISCDAGNAGNDVCW